MGPEKAVCSCPAPSSPPCQGRGEHQQSSPSSPPCQGRGEHQQSALSFPLAPETFIETQVSSFILLREGNRMVNCGKASLVACWTGSPHRKATAKSRQQSFPFLHFYKQLCMTWAQKKSSLQGNKYCQRFLVSLWRSAADTRLTRLCCLASFSLASSSSFWILRTCLFILRIVECKISQTNSLKVTRRLVTVCQTILEENKTSNCCDLHILIKVW